MNHFDDDTVAPEPELATPEQIDALSQEIPDANAQAPEDGGGEPNSRAEKRIKGLIKKNSALLEKFNQLQGKFDALTAQQGGTPAPAAPAQQGERTIQDFTEAELQSALRESGSEPDVVFAVNKELARRQAAEAASQARDEFKAQSDAQARAQQAWGQVQQTYGPTALDPNSPLRQSAEIVAASFRNTFGDDVFEKKPELLNAAFGVAYGRRAGAALKQAQDENTKLRNQLKQMQGPSRAAERSAETQAAVSSHLEKGDVDSAIRELPLLKQLRNIGG